MARRTEAVGTQRGDEEPATSPALANHKKEEKGLRDFTRIYPDAPIYHIYVHLLLIYMSIFFLEWPAEPWLWLWRGQMMVAHRRDIRDNVGEKGWKNLIYCLRDSQTRGSRWYILHLRCFTMVGKEPRYFPDSWYFHLFLIKREIYRSRYFSN